MNRPVRHFPEVPLMEVVVQFCSSDYLNPLLLDLEAATAPHLSSTKTLVPCRQL